MAVVSSGFQGADEIAGDRGANRAGFLGALPASDTCYLARRWYLAGRGSGPGAYLVERMDLRVLAT